MDPRFARFLHGVALTSLLSFGFAVAAEGQSSVSDAGGWAVTGEVNAVVYRGETQFVGGATSYVGPYTGGFALLDATAQVRETGWPNVTGPVRGVVSDGEGGWYLAGSFTRVGGSAHGPLVHIRADHSVEEWNPRVDGAVQAIARTGGRLFVGGAFTAVNGQARNRLASFDLSTGSLTSWNPGTNGEVLSMLASGSRLYLGGSFSSVAGVVRRGAAAVDVASGVLTSWNPDVPGWIHVLLADNDRILLGGEFERVGGQPRNDLASVDAVSGAVSSWDPNIGTGAPGVRALAIDAGTLFVAGLFNTASGQPRNGLASFDLSTGLLTGWNPPGAGWNTAITAGGGRVYATGRYPQTWGREALLVFDRLTGALIDDRMEANEQVTVLRYEAGRLQAGGDFTSIGGRQVSGLAAIDLAADTLLSWAPKVNGVVRCLAVSNEVVFVGGQFDSIGGRARRNLAAISLATGEPTDWVANTDAPVNALLLLDGRLHVGGDFLRIGGEQRGYIGAVDAVTARVLPWAPVVDWRVRRLCWLDGRIFAGGDFSHVENREQWGAAAFDPLTGAASPFDPRIWGSIYAFELRDDRLIMGGNFAMLDSNGAVVREGVVAVDVASGRLLPWNPGRLSGEVRALELVGNTLFVGGQAISMDGVHTDGMIALDASTGATLNWSPGFAYPFLYVEGMAGTPGWLNVWGFVAALPNNRQIGLARYSTAGMDSEPPVAHVIAPNGGEAVYLGEPLAIEWTATDDMGVASVDVQLCRTGASGPWETLASGIPNSGSFAWTAAGATSNFEARIRVVARDAAGLTGEDVSDGGFAITTAPVPTLVELFRLEDGANGVTIRWVADERASFSPQRGETESGEWTNVAGSSQLDGRARVVIDRQAEAGALTWYRLTGTAADGRPATVAPLSILHGAVTSLALDRVAPNPVRSATQVSFALPSAARVQLALLDVQGRTVATLSDGARGAGRHVARLEVGDLPAGLYFLRLNAGGTELRRRVVVVH